MTGPRAAAPGPDSRKLRKGPDGPATGGPRAEEATIARTAHR